MASEFFKWRCRDVKPREGAGLLDRKKRPGPEGDQALWDTLTEGAAV